MHHADTTAQARFVELVTAAQEYLAGRQARLREEFRIGEYERYAMIDEGRTIEFSTAGVARVRAAVQFVGSVSRTSGTWLWGWANPEVPEELVHEVRDVRLYGESQGLWRLTTPKWEADEVDGWEMTSIAAYVLRAAGAYRAPTPELFSFIVLRDVAWVGAPADANASGAM